MSVDGFSVGMVQGGTYVMFVTRVVGKVAIVVVQIGRLAVELSVMICVVLSIQIAIIPTVSMIVIYMPCGRGCVRCI